MAKPNLRKYGAMVYALLSILLAIVLRQIGIRTEGPISWVCGMLRAVLQIGLFTFWGISIRRRIIQPQVRRYLATISALMVFWLTVRTIRYLIAKSPVPFCLREKHCIPAGFHLYY